MRKTALSILFVCLVAGQALGAVPVLDWTKPERPPAWWINLAEWRADNPGDWVVGVSGLSEDEGDAKLAARANALLVHGGEAAAQAKLEEHGTYLRVYKAPDGKALYKVYVLFKLPEPGIVATGVAVIKGDDKEAAQKEAVEDALRNAVKMSTGANIGGSTAAKRSELTDGRLLAKVTDVVTSYKILEVNEMNGITQVTLRATVDGATFNKLDLGKVRVAVVCGGERADAVQAGIESSLKEAGLSVVALPGDFSTDSPLDKVAKEARTHSVDLVLFVGTQTKEKDKFGKLILYSAEMTLKAVKPLSMEMAAVKRMTIDGARKQDAADAAESAVTKATVAAGKYVAEEIVKNSPGLAEVVVVLNGVDNRLQLGDVRAELFKKPGVRDVVVRGYSGSAAVLVVKADPDVKDLVGGYLENLEGVPVHVEKHFVDGVEARVIEKEKGEEK